AGGSDRLVDVLGLTAVAVRRYYHAPGDAVGDPRALFLPDQVEARVDARGRARAGDHRVVVDVENVGIDLGRRVAAGQFGGAPPVRGAPAAVQQAGLAQDEGARADAQHAGAPVHRPAQRLQQVFGEEPEPVRPLDRLARVDAEPLVVDRGQRDQVRGLQPLQAAGGVDGEVVVGVHRRRLAG